MATGATYITVSLLRRRSTNDPDEREPSTVANCGVPQSLRRRTTLPSITVHVLSPTIVISWPPTADLAPFISVAAGVTGVIIAVGVDLVRRRWQRPKLRLLSFRVGKGDGSYLDILDGRQDAWLRLGILNEGRQAARDVEVHIEDITLGDPAPDEERLETFQKQHLTGVIGRRLGWANRDESTVTIPPGIIRRVDIAHVLNGEPSYAVDGDLAVPIRIALHGGSRLNRHIVAGLNYSLRLSLSASNCRTALFDLELAFGGRWLGPSTIDPSVPGSLRIVNVTRVRARIHSTR